MNADAKINKANKTRFSYLDTNFEIIKSLFFSARKVNVVFRNLLINSG